MASRGLLDSALLALAPPLAALVIRLLRATMRVRCVGREGLDALRARGGRYIHAFWHGHLLLMPYAYPGSRIAILISEHRDGEYIARTMARFGHLSVRGSTTSGGAAALRRAVRLARDEGYDLGFTPDGPRGPRHRVQMGAIMAARLSGLPIVPVAFGASRARVMGSWDGFIVPLPFARGVFAYGEPIEVPRDAAEGAMETERLRLEAALEACARRAAELAADPARFAALVPLRASP
jgi:lysophospholipid acyltransferase (LPLAT)-like uncharacterized protein